MKDLFVWELKEGMVVGKDILTTTGIMVIPSGVVITDAIKTHLESLGILNVTIDDEAKPVEKTPVGTKEFKEFRDTYVKTKDKLNDAFDKIISKQITKEETEAIIDESWKMIDTSHNSYNMMEMIYSLHNYSDATYMHCMNVGMIAVLIGKWLGWKEDDLKLLNACGMFHDIGKLAISKEILDKPGRLTDAEYEEIKKHTIKGYEMLKGMGLDQRIINAAIMHHERCDGSGYPLKLTGNKIDRFSKIIAIADVYEAMTANRVYRGPMCPFDVIAQFENEGFGLYETKYLFVFLQNIVDTYLHSRVELNNGEHAEVVLINRQRGSKPVVMTTSGNTVDLMREPSLKIQNILE